MERRSYLDAHRDVFDGAAGGRVAVGKGYLASHRVITGAGMVEVRKPLGE